jgi:hypothetical protein
MNNKTSPQEPSTPIENMNCQQTILRQLANKENGHKGFSPTPKRDEASLDRELTTAQELLRRIIQKRLFRQGCFPHDKRRVVEALATSKKGQENQPCESLVSAQEKRDDGSGKERGDWRAQAA